MTPANKPYNYGGDVAIDAKCVTFLSNRNGRTFTNKSGVEYKDYILWFLPWGNAEIACHTKGRISYPITLILKKV